MLEAILIVFTYLIMWGVTIGVRERTLTWTNLEGPERAFGHIFFGVGWIIYLPVFLSYLAVKKGLPKIKLPKIRRSKEIAKGIPCPIDVLIQMAKASLLKDFEVKHDNIINKKVNLYCYRNFSSQLEVRLVVGKTVLENSDFTVEMREDLEQFHKSILELDKNRIEAEKLAESRNKAIDGIETLLTIEE